MNYLFYISVTYSLEDILMRERKNMFFLFFGLVVKNLYLCIVFLF